MWTDFCPSLQIRTQKLSVGFKLWTCGSYPQWSHIDLGLPVFSHCRGRTLPTPQPPAPWPRGLLPHRSQSTGAAGSRSNGGHTRVHRPSRSRWGPPAAQSTWHTESRWGAIAYCTLPCLHRPQGCRRGPLPCRTHRPRREWGHQGYEVVRRTLWHGFKFPLSSLYFLRALQQVNVPLCSSVFASSVWDNNITYLVGCCED